MPDLVDSKTAIPTEEIDQFTDTRHLFPVMEGAEIFSSELLTRKSVHLSAGLIDIDNIPFQFGNSHPVTGLIADGLKFANLSLPAHALRDLAFQ